MLASLGEGGMARVYLAMRSKSAGRSSLVAVKVLREDVAFDDRELSEMFVDEARMAAGLVHPNIVRTYEVGAFEGRHFMVMEYLEGQSLYAIQETLSPRALPLPEELRIIAQTALGLHYAHEKRAADGTPLGIIHRDISPQNVFVTYDGQVKLLDFGIAKAATDTHRTRVGIVKGKIDYMSPEQLKSEPLDRRSDIFALGAMLWEAITGKRFSGGERVDEKSKIQLRISGGEPPVRALKPDVPAALASIVERALALDREQRYEDAAQFAHDIERFLTSSAPEPTAHSLAAQLAITFGQERAEIRSLVESQMARLTADPEGPSATRGARSLESLEKDADLLRLSRPSFGPGAGAASQARTGRTRPSDPDSLSNAPTAPPSAPPPGSPTAATFSRARIAGAIAAFGLAIVAGRFLASVRQAPPIAEPIASPAPLALPNTPAPAVAQVEPVSTVRVTIDVDPPDAVVKLDGAPLPALPYADDVRASEQVHQLEASAAGRRTQSLLVTFDRDRAIKIVLPKVAP